VFYLHGSIDQLLGPGKYKKKGGKVYKQSLLLKAAFLSQEKEKLVSVLIPLIKTGRRWLLIYNEN